MLRQAPHWQGNRGDGFRSQEVAPQRRATRRKLDGCADEGNPGPESNTGQISLRMFQALLLLVGWGEMLAKSLSYKMSVIVQDKNFDAVQDVRLCAVGAPGGSRAWCRRGKKDSIKYPSNKYGGVEPKFSTR